MEILKTREVFRDPHWFLDILDTELRTK